MKIDTVEINPNDVVMVHYYIGNTPADKVDGECERLLNKLKGVFHCEIAIVPCREQTLDGQYMEFTIVRNLGRKLKKVA